MYLTIYLSRHVIMSEFADVVSALPVSLARAPATSWDPLPPADSINTYTAPTRQQTVLGKP